MHLNSQKGKLMTFVPKYSCNSSQPFQEEALFQDSPRSSPIPSRPLEAGPGMASQGASLWLEALSFLFLAASSFFWSAPGRELFFSSKDTLYFVLPGLLFPSSFLSCWRLPFLSPAVSEPHFFSPGPWEPIREQSLWSAARSQLPSPPKVNRMSRETIYRTIYINSCSHWVPQRVLHQNSSWNSAC